MTSASCFSKVDHSVEAVAECLAWLPGRDVISIREARPFVVIASQRTGSTLLVRSLDAAPGIFCAGELFHGGPHVHHAEFNYPKDSWLRGLLRRALPDALEQRRVRGHLESFFSVAGTGVQAVGFKVMASQLRQHQAILPALKSLGVTLLFLYRRDSFSTALSYARAKVSRVYHSDRPGQATCASPIRIDSGEFKSIMARCTADQAAIRAMHDAHGGTLLAYEDMSDHWEEFVESVGRALGLKGLKLVPALERLGIASPAVSILNEDALRSEFAEFQGSRQAAGNP